MSERVKRMLQCYREEMSLAIRRVKEGEMTIDEALLSIKYTYKCARQFLGLAYRFNIFTDSDVIILSDELRLSRILRSEYYYYINELISRRWL